MMNSGFKLGSEEALKKFWEYFIEQNNILGEIEFLEKKDGSHWFAVRVLVHFLVGINNDLISLSGRGSLRSVNILARTSFETIVNIAYIISDGRNASNQALLHAIQKSVREYQRKLDKKDMKVEYGQSEIFQSIQKNFPEIQELIDNFTTKKGKEITSWTPHNINSRLEIIEKKYPDKIVWGGLHGGLISIYRNASDIVHGTLFGALYCLRGTTLQGLPKSREEMALHIFISISTILFSLCKCLNALFYIFSKELNITFSFDKATILDRECRKIIKNSQKKAK